MKRNLAIIAAIFFFMLRFLSFLFPFTICGSGVPFLRDHLHEFQALCILVLFPLIVLTGAGSVTEGRTSTAFCRWLGGISYPIYITHYPLIYMQMAWVASNPEAPLWQHVAVAVGVLFIAIILAWGLQKAYDEPVREWLKDHWLHRKKAV